MIARRLWKQQCRTL